MKHLVALFSFVCSLSAWGQDWYEIEVLIFEHNYNPYENPGDVESWPSDLALDWPTPLIELGTAIDAQDENQTGAEPTEQALDTDSDYPVPEPFLELPESARQLTNANYALRVRDRYDLLWHKVWTAPLLPEENSPWIEINAGEQIGDHFRLEGGIRVHLARYLHLHTNLWLTELQDDQPEVQSEFHWSQLPAPELSRWPCIFIQEDWPDSERRLPDDYFDEPAPGGWYYPFGCIASDDEPAPDDDSYSPLALPMPLESQLTAEAETQTDSLAVPYDNYSTGVKIVESKPVHALEQLRFRSDKIEEEGDAQPDEILMLSPPSLAELESEGVTQATEAFFEQSFPVERITHIQSERRMRSEELHYIDHPRVGILAIIRPIEKPILEAKPVEYISAPLPSSRVGEP